MIENIKKKGKIRATLPLKRRERKKSKKVRDFVT